MSNPSPPVIQLGASIAVATTTELGTLDVSHLNPGTQVFVSADNTLWTLEISTATVGAGVIAVAGVTGWRWIEQGGTTGFVTIAQLADTTVTSGATLVGVNANAGMFSQPDLQHVLQTDVTLKNTLAASDGTGGASLVGVQDTANYFGGSHQLEPVLAQLGASKNPVQLTTGQKFEVDLADAGTNSAAVTRLTVHTTSGTAAAGFGAIDKTQLENASGTTKDATALQSKWKTATNAAEDGAIDVQAMVGGTLTTLATFNGKNATSNFPVEVPTFNVDNAAMGFTATGSQEIQKKGTGNLNLRGLGNSGNAVTMQMLNYPGVQVIQRAGYPDTIIGPNAALGPGDVDGFLFIPTVTSTGAMSSPPGTLPTGETAVVFNRADKKLAAYDNTHWLYSTLIATPQTVGASLTNNVTAGGTTNVVDNWTSLTVYATDAAAIRNAIYQLALKVANLELALKKNTSQAIT